MEAGQEGKKASFFGRAWKWIAGGFTLMLAVAGFASPEFRGAICLDLPREGDFEYAAVPAQAKTFREISTRSRQPALDGTDLVFRARYYGETIPQFYTSFLSPERMKGYAFLNLREMGFVPEDTPLGSTSIELPKALVLMPLSEAAVLSDLPNGTIVQIRGVGREVLKAEPGSALAQYEGKVAMAIPDANAFYVLGEDIEIIKPLNPAESRFLCRIFHRFDA
ncbi:MAG: hypothetical protein ACJ8GV_05355 [Luteimonas sp.]